MWKVRGFGLGRTIESAAEKTLDVTQRKILAESLVPTMDVRAPQPRRGWSWLWPRCGRFGGLALAARLRAQRVQGSALPIAGQAPPGV
jgi:hypothetical protein